MFTDDMVEEVFQLLWDDRDEGFDYEVACQMILIRNGFDDFSDETFREFTKFYCDNVERIFG